MRLKTILYATVLLLLCSVACSKKDTVVINNDVTRFTQFPKEVDITFKDFLGYEYGKPCKFVMMDTILVIFNESRGKGRILYRYDLKNKSFVGKGLIDKGKGPYEVWGGASLGITDTSFWIHDISQKKILLLPKDQLLLKNPIFKEYYLEGRYYQIEMLNDHRFLSTGNETKPIKTQALTIDEKVLHEFGKFGSVPADMSLDLLKDAMHSGLFLHPKKHKLAVPYVHQDVLEIYDLKPPFKCKAVQGPDLFPMIIKKGTGWGGRQFMRKHIDTYNAFDLTGSATDDYIYMGYAGIPSLVRSKLQAWGSKSIFIYDWEGNPIKRLNLDRRIECFVVSDDNKTIYAYDVDTGFIIKAAI